MFAVGLVPLFLFLMLPNWGHGTFMNPIMVTDDDLSDASGKPYMEALLRGEIKLTPMNTPKIINTMEEVEIAPMYTGWGNNYENGVYHYKMSDEMYEKFCPSWERVKEMVDSKETLIAGRNLYHYGAYPVGCGRSAPKMINQTEEKLGPDRTLYFNSEFWSQEEIREMTGVDVDARFISTFFDQIQRPILNSPYHNAMVASIAIQCYGGKWWTFAAPRGMAKYGTRSYNGATILRGMDEDEEHFVVYTEPGTIISFPPWWPHFVISDAGNTFLYTLRKVYPSYFTFLKTNTQLTIEVLSRFFAERLSLFNTLPPNNGRTAHENSRTYVDVHSNEDCKNEITLEDLTRLMDYQDKVLGRK